MGSVALLPISPSSGVQSSQKVPLTVRADPRELQGAGDNAGLLIQFTPSASYATGGDTLDLSQYFSYAIRDILIFQNGSKYLPGFVAGTTLANGKIKIWDTSTDAEVANTTDLHLQKFTAWVFGT